MEVRTEYFRWSIRHVADVRSTTRERLDGLRSCYLRPNPLLSEGSALHDSGPNLQREGQQVLVVDLSERCVNRVSDVNRLLSQGAA